MVMSPDCTEVGKTQTLSQKKNDRTKKSHTTMNMSKHTRAKIMKKKKAKEKKTQLRRKTKNTQKQSGTNWNQSVLDDIKEFLLIFFNTTTLW